MRGRAPYQRGGGGGFLLEREEEKKNKRRDFIDEIKTRARAKKSARNSRAERERKKPPLARSKNAHHVILNLSTGIKATIDDMLTKLPQPAQDKLGDLEKSTGQPKSLIAGGGAVFSCLLFLFLCPPFFVFNIVGCAYPIYASLKMLAEENTDDATMRDFRRFCFTRALPSL